MRSQTLAPTARAALGSGSGSKLATRASIRPAVIAAQRLPCPPSSHRSYTSYESPHISKPPRHGQPLRSTHPRSLKEGELTPHVPKAEYEERRSRLMRSLPEGSVVVCMGGTTRLMTQRTY